MRAPQLPLFKEKIQYCDIVFLFLFILWFIQIKKVKMTLQRTPLILSFITMLGMFLFSFIHSSRYLQSSIEFMGIFYLVCLYFIFCQIIDSEEVWWKIIKCWVIVSFFISVTGVFAYMISVFCKIPTFLIIQWNLNYHLGNRLNSFFRHPAMLATYLHTSIVFAFILAGASKNHIKNKWWIYATIIFCIIAAILTKTRVIAGILMTIFLIINSLKNKNALFAFMKYSAFLFFVMITVFVFILLRWEFFPVKFNINKENKSAQIEINLAPQVYYIIHKKAARIIKDYPFIGVGMGMYNYTPGYVKWEEAKDSYRIYYPNVTEKDEDIYSIGSDPHSTYLGWTAETGLLGLSGIILVLLGGLYSIYQRSRNTIDLEKKLLYQCILAGISGFLLNGYFIDILTMRHFWILFAMGLILVRFSITQKISNLKQNIGA